MNVYAGRCMYDTTPAPGQGHGDVRGTTCANAPSQRGVWYDG